MEIKLMGHNSLYQVEQLQQTLFGVDAPGSFMIWISQRTTSFAMEMPGYRYDVGNLDSYQKIREEYKGITC